MRADHIQALATTLMNRSSQFGNYVSWLASHISDICYTCYIYELLCVLLNHKTILSI